MRDDEERESVYKFEDENKREVIGYIPFFFIASPQKESSRPTNMSKKTKNLNYLV